MDYRRTTSADFFTAACNQQDRGSSLHQFDCNWPQFFMVSSGSIYNYVNLVNSINNPSPQCCFNFWGRTNYFESSKIKIWKIMVQYICRIQCIFCLATSNASPAIIYIQIWTVKVVDWLLYILVMHLVFSKFWWNINLLSPMFENNGVIFVLFRGTFFYQYKMGFMQNTTVSPPIVAAPCCIYLITQWIFSTGLHNFIDS